MQALWMVLAGFFFATMGWGIKHASAFFNTAEILFHRGWIGVVLLWLLLRMQGQSVRTAHPWMHLWRSTIGFASMACWFYAITVLPLATAMTFNYTSGLWMGAFFLLAALWSWRPSHKGGRQPLNLSMLLAIAVGFAGVLLILRPSSAGGLQQDLATMLAPLVGMFAALAYMQIVRLSRVGEPELRTVFYFALVTTVGGALGMFVLGISAMPGWSAMLWMLLVGVCAMGGQLCMTRAYASSTTARSTLLVANLQYTGLIFSSLYSVLWFGDQLDATAWVGMLLIAGSGIAASILRARPTGV